MKPRHNCCSSSAWTISDLPPWQKSVLCMISATQRPCNASLNSNSQLSIRSLKALLPMSPQPLMMTPFRYVTQCLLQISCLSVAFTTALKPVLSANNNKLSFKTCHASFMSGLHAGNATSESAHMACQSLPSLVLPLFTDMACQSHAWSSHWQCNIILQTCYVSCTFGLCIGSSKIFLQTCHVSFMLCTCWR